MSDTVADSSPRSGPTLADVATLFFRPRRFFSTVELDHRWWYLSALVIAGLSTASGRVDQNIMREELGQARPGWEQFAPFLLDSWFTLWLFLLGAAALYAPFYWYVGGWWYKVRLRWSGAEAPDPRAARLVMASAGVVVGLPTVLFLIGETAVYSDYREAWASEELLSVALLIFPFWSVYTSYRGVKTRFDVAKWKARIWFLILPGLVFAFALGLIAVLYAVFFYPVGPAGGNFAMSVA